MNVNGITANTYIPSVKAAGKTSSKTSSFADIYEKSAHTTGNSKPKAQNAAVIKALKEDTENRAEQLRSLVQKMMLAQGKTFDAAGMWNFLQSKEYSVDEETAKQAQADIAEDGYWGIEQTSDRLVSFARALAADNPEKADEMIEAVKTGFEQATKVWGGELPDICKKTLDATLKKLNSWKNPSTDESQ
ncbi:hypothetical protein [Anaerocolumna xylanovorans]|uniref:Uncharacterized protein n=1 Tax=Anaerocolumna xylanovorans DSM 12503 TaxID=1121345 RepID=A0A1M7YK13_9FIRM|nr:hypothetical protein [Anaerocolumna xylanovorans]SHO52960.1 hypothetical protein SAMN02745217_03888 [Anaerocolumna xylanovorans DSM 12503]